MRFLADMGVSPGVVAWLRQQGHDAVHLYERGMDRASDPVVLATARTEGRVVLTMDLDFARLLAQSGATEPSVVIFRLVDERPAHVNGRLAAGAIVSVGERAIRVRPLPIQQQP